MSTLDSKRLIKRFLKYVKTSSPSKSEAKFGELLCKELLKLRIKSRKDKIGNIYAFLKGKTNSNPVLLNAHIDTVAHESPIKPRIKKGIITSDGSTILGADNKAGIAVIIETLQILKEEKFPHPDIQIIFTVQEEIGLKGANAIRKKLFRAKLGYVLDGGDINTIYFGAPSQENITAEIAGRAAHAGVHPELGINAIKVASEAIAKMKLGRIDFETTANIGIIEGGKATNIIPEKVFLKGEARSHNKSKLKSQIAKMKKCIIESCRKHKAKARIEIEKVYDSFHVSEKEEVVLKAKCALKSLGLVPKVKLTGGGSDANVFNKLNVKSVIIGAGADNVHTAREKIKINDIVLGVKYLLNIIRNV